MSFKEELLEENIEIRDSSELLDMIENNNEGIVAISVDNPDVQISIATIEEDIFVNSVINEVSEDIYIKVNDIEVGTKEDVRIFIDDNFKEGYVLKSDIEDKIDVEKYKNVDEKVEFQEDNIAPDMEMLEDGESILSPEDMYNPDIVITEEISDTDYYDLEAFTEDDYQQLFDAQYEEEFDNNVVFNFELEDNVFPFDIIENESAEIQNQEDASSESVEIDDKSMSKEAYDSNLEMFSNLDGFLSKVSPDNISALFKGYIPMEMRDSGNIRGNTDMVIPRAVIDKIRENTPDFGKMIGGTVDTSSKHYIGYVEAGKIKEYLQEDNDSIKNCRIYVDYGERHSINIDKQFNINGYHPVNLYTFEFEMKDGSKEYTVCVGNDLGHIYKEIPLFENSPSLVINDTVKYDFLDRTNPDNKGHFKQIEAIATDSFGYPIRENGKIVQLKNSDGSPVFLSQKAIGAIRDKLEAANGPAIKEISQRILTKLDNEEEIVQSKIEIIKEKESNLREIYDNAAFVKEYYAVRLENAVTDLDSISDKIADLLVTLDKISEKDSEQYNSVVSTIEQLKGEYLSKIDNISEFASRCDVSDGSLSYREISDIANDAKNIYESVLDARENMESYYDVAYGGDLEEFISAKNPEEIFNSVIDIDTSKAVEIDISKYNSSISLSDKAIQLKADMVEKWNKEDGHEKMQLSLDKETGEIWTGYGTKVEIEKIEGELPEFNADKIDRNLVNLIDTPLEQLENKDFEKESVKAYLDSKVDNSDISIKDISSSFIDNSLRNGYKKESLDRLERGGLNNLTDNLEIKVSSKGVSLDKIADLIISDKEEQIEKRENDTEQVDKGAKPTIEIIKPTDKTFDAEDIVRPVTNTFGKVDVSKEIKLSAKKEQEIRELARKKIGVDKPDKPEEAKYDAYEKFVSEKRQETLETLQSIREDIITIKAKLDELDDFPQRFKYMDTFYTKYKMDFDAKVRAYVNAGGRVGKNCFCQRGVSSKELFVDFASFLKSNLIVSVELRGIFKILDAIDAFKNRDKVEKTDNQNAEISKEIDDIADKEAEILDKDKGELAEADIKDMDNVEEDRAEISDTDKEDISSEAIDDEKESDDEDMKDVNLEAVESEGNKEEPMEMKKNDTDTKVIENEDDKIKSVGIEEKEFDSGFTDGLKEDKAEPINILETEENTDKGDDKRVDESLDNKNNDTDLVVYEDDEDTTTTDEKEQLIENIKDEIEKYIDGVDSMGEAIVEGLSEGLTPQDLIDAACNVIFDRILELDGEYDENIIESIADIINTIGDYADDIPSDIRDDMYDELADLGLSDDIIQSIEEEASELKESLSNNVESATEVELYYNAVSEIIDSGMDSLDKISMELDNSLESLKENIFSEIENTTNASDDVDLSENQIQDVDTNEVDDSGLDYVEPDTVVNEPDNDLETFENFENQIENTDINDVDTDVDKNEELSSNVDADSGQDYFDLEDIDTDLAE